MTAMGQLPLQFEVPRATLANAAARRILLADGWLPYGFTRAKRRTLSITVRPQGIEIRAPRWVSITQVEAFIREKENWIRRRMADFRHGQESFAWRDGAYLPFFGRLLVLESVPATATSLRREILLESECLKVPVDPSEGPVNLRSAVLPWLRASALTMFRDRVVHFAQLLGVPVPEVRLSNARTQWGSCNASGRVLLNWRLVHLPFRLVDYVVAHEVAHLREMNHSEKFWALVESACPGCREARRELNVLGKNLPDL